MRVKNKADRKLGEERSGQDKRKRKRMYKKTSVLKRRRNNTSTGMKIRSKEERGR